MSLALLNRRVPATAPAAPVSAAEARRLILRGDAPAGLRVSGHLKLADQASLTALPAGLSVDSLDLSNCAALRELPDGLRVRRLNLSGCTGLRQLPAGLHCYSLELRQTRLRSLPADLQVEYLLDLTDCADLEVLPVGLTVGSLVLRGCTALTTLPEGLDVCFLDISGCIHLTGWPRQGAIRFGHLAARGCTGLTALPDWLTGLAQLDLRGCVNLRELPAGLAINSWVDLADTALAALPAAARGAQLRWKGVPVDERIAFRPETITVQEVLETANVERRRVLLERMGYDRFLAQAKVDILDRDSDPGGERQLVRVPLPDDEPLVCLAVYCPSTGRQYVLRVPPAMRTCRQAAAWLAGFDDPDDYRPLVEA